MNTYTVDIAQHVTSIEVTYSHTVTVHAETETGALIAADAHSGYGQSAMWATRIPQTFTIEYRDLTEGERVLFETDNLKDARDVKWAVEYRRDTVLIECNY